MLPVSITITGGFIFFFFTFFFFIVIIVGFVWKSLEQTTPVMLRAYS